MTLNELLAKLHEQAEEERRTQGPKLLGLGEGWPRSVFDWLDKVGLKF